MEARAKVLLAERRWNRIVDHLLSAKKEWELNREAMLGMNLRTLELGSPKGQEHLSKNFNKSEFNVGLERMIAYWRLKGGLENLLIQEVKDGRARTGQ